MVTRREELLFRAAYLALLIDEGKKDYLGHNERNHLRGKLHPNKWPLKETDITEAFSNSLVLLEDEFLTEIIYVWFSGCKFKNSLSEVISELKDIPPLCAKIQNLTENQSVDPISSWFVTELDKRNLISRKK